MHNNLRAEMARKGITIGEISNYLGKRYGTINDKINGKYGFYYSEALSIKEKFFPEHNIEYLFYADTENKKGVS